MNNFFREEKKKLEKDLSSNFQLQNNKCLQKGFTSIISWRYKNQWNQINITGFQKVPVA